jgi:hypothetical protein
MLPRYHGSKKKGKDESAALRAVVTPTSLFGGYFLASCREQWQRVSACSTTAKIF